MNDLIGKLKTEKKELQQKLAAAKKQNNALLP